MKLFTLLITLVTVTITLRSVSFGEEVLYEINTRQYPLEGTLGSVYDDLARLKKLGVTILWFMPIHNIGTERRKGSIGSPYSIKDYRSINPLLGTKSEFRKIVDKAHKLEMKVILDWVANHTAWDHHWARTNPEFYNRDELGNFIPPVAEWNDVIDLNYHNPELRKAMLADMKYWVEEFDIDGFRCDVASMVPTEFWLEARKQLKEVKRNHTIFMLGESSERDLMDSGAFDAIYGDDVIHEFYEVIHDRALPEVIHRRMSERYQSGIGSERIFMNFSTNHDVNYNAGPMSEIAGPGEQSFLAITFLLPGIPLVFNGQENGLNKKLNFFEPDQLPDVNINHPNYELISNLSKIKQTKKDILTNANASLYKAHYTDRYQDPDILIFSRESILDVNHRILVMMNLSGNFRKFKIYNPDPKTCGKHLDLITDLEFHIDCNSELELKPWEFRILEKKENYR